MRWIIVLAAVGLSSQAHADRIEPFVSAGASISYGSRGLVLGLELSGGRILDDPHYVPMYGGVALGIDVAVVPRPRQPTGRAYLEAEFGILFGGVGFGPAIFFGDDDPGPHFQITPYLTVAVVHECSEPWVAISPFFRYTTHGKQRRILEGGAFVKGLGFPNGHRDDLACGGLGH